MRQKVSYPFRWRVRLRESAAIVLALACLLAGYARTASVPSERWQDLVREVEHLRGLKFKKPLQWETLTDAKLQQLLDRAFAERAQQLPGLEKVLRMMGLLRENQTLRALLEPLYRQQIAGVYDPRSRRMYVRNVSGGTILDSVLVHELTHALVDQHFDLKAYIYDPTLERDSEQQVARQAVAEGDATLVMLAFQLKRMGLDTSIADLASLDRQVMDNILGMASTLDPRFSGLPAWLLRLFVAPYLDGFRIVTAAYRRAGWDGVNRLYRNPPRTTEHLLHPDRYFTAEPIRWPELPPAPEASPEFEDTFGELSWRLWFQHFLHNHDDANRAADGWDGDRGRLVRTADGSLHWQLVSVWDNEAEAREFARFFQRAMKKRSQDAKLVTVKWEVRVEGDRVMLDVVQGTARTAVH